MISHSSGAWKVPDQGTSMAGSGMTLLPGWFTDSCLAAVSSHSGEIYVGSHYLPKAPAPNTVTLGIMASIYEFRSTHSVHNNGYS